MGDGFGHSVTVIVTTGGYVVAIPELDRGVNGLFVTVGFLDAIGAVVGTSSLREKQSRIVLQTRASSIVGDALVSSPRR